MRWIPLMTVAALAAGCNDNAFKDQQGGAGGVPIFQAFNFSTVRTWTFLSDEGSLGYRLQARQIEGSEEIGGQDVYTVEFQYDCVNNTQGDCADNQLEGTVATTWKLSSSLGEGVLWHQLGETTFDPPVQIAEARMLEGDTVTSESDGVTYTSEYVDLIPCPAENYWPDPESRADCYHLQVTADGDADLVGNYYIAQRFTFAAFQQGGDSEPTWELLGFDEAE